MKYWAALISLIVCGNLWISDAALAEKRAFVVGINKYAPLTALTTAVDDAAQLSKSLGELGFQVEMLQDADRVEFDRKWAAFLASLKAGDILVFHFAGHGIQVEGANYLLPRDN